MPSQSEYCGYCRRVTFRADVPARAGRSLGRETFVTDRAVDTHITNLRKKIESKASEPRFLASVRGMGYRFDG